MNTHSNFPFFDTEFPELNQFILGLVDEHMKGKLNSWDDLDQRVKLFYTPEQMDSTEAKVPGWKKMASYSHGITQTHVTCVFLGMFMLPEFLALNAEQQQLTKWIVLFHDLEKVPIRGKRDSTHAFRSAVTAAKSLQGIGFPVTNDFDTAIQLWSEYTNSAVTNRPSSRMEQISDNKKLPEIVAGIETLYGKDTPGSLIVKGVLFHMCVQVVKDWPQPSPLTDEEIESYIDRRLFALLKVMHLADNDGWTLFEPERESYVSETLEAFERVHKIISN